MPYTRKPLAQTPLPAMQQTIAGLAPPSNWGQYIGDGTATGGARGSDFWKQEEADQALKYIRQFDPDASIDLTSMPDGSGGQYIRFDNSKLPTNTRGQKGILGLSNLDGLKNNSDYMGSRGVDKVWGNVGQSESRAWTEPRSLVDTVGPMVPGLFMGGLGLLGGFSGGLGGALVNGGLNAARSVGSGSGFNPMSLLPILGKIPGLFSAGPGG